MDENEFWRVIGLFNWKRTGDDDAVLKPAVKEPAKKSPEEIAAFEEIMSKKLYALDAPWRMPSGLGRVRMSMADNIFLSMLFSTPAVAL